MGSRSAVRLHLPGNRHEFVVCQPATVDVAPLLGLHRTSELFGSNNLTWRGRTVSPATLALDLGTGVVYVIFRSGRDPRLHAQQLELFRDEAGLGQQLAVA